MKSLNFYKEVIDCNSDNQVFDYLVNNFKPSNALWSYFVNWEKVFKNTKEIEIELNLLNYLIGKDDFDSEFRLLVKRNPEVLRAIPALIVRNGSNTNKFKVLVDFSNKRLVYEDFDFTIKDPNELDVSKYLDFVKNTGLKDLIVSKKIKNLVDYIIGVEAGLDSNGRKNRSGKAMEKITGPFIKDICDKYGFKYLEQANASKIKSALGYDVPVNKSSKRYDYVVDNGKELFLFETNFYGSKGSKLSEITASYRDLFNVLEGKFKFVWITDGYGWKYTIRSLRDTFDHNDYVFTLDLLEKGILEEVLK